MALNKSRQIIGTVAIGVMIASSPKLESATARTELLSNIAISHTATGITPFTVNTASAFNLKSEITTNLATDGISPYNNHLLEKKDGDIWSQIGSMFGAWSHLDDQEIDNWFTNLRDRDDNRLAQLYDNDWE
jgi:hypothetical protein